MPASLIFQRFAQVITIHQGCEDKYDELCRRMSNPEVGLNQAFSQCNVRNFSIFRKVRAPAPQPLRSRAGPTNNLLQIPPLLTPSALLPPPPLQKPARVG